MKNPILTTIILIFMAFFQINCALTKETIHIDYNPRQNAQIISGADKITVGLAVKDRRADQTLEVARKINGFGSEMAPISNDESIPLLLERAIKEELLMRGYKISEAYSNLIIELLGFTHKFNAGFFAGDSKATVTLLVRVKSNNGSDSFEKTYSDSFSHSIQVATGRNVKQAFEEALPGAVRKLMDDPDFHAALAKTYEPKAEPSTASISAQ